MGLRRILDALFSPPLFMLLFIGFMMPALGYVVDDDDNN